MFSGVIYPTIFKDEINTRNYLIVHTNSHLNTTCLLLHLDHNCNMAGSQIKSDSKYDDFDYPTVSPEVKAGHPGHTTPEQDAQVFQLRTQLEQAKYTERLDTLSMVGRSISSCIPYLISIHSSDFYGLESSMLSKQNSCR